jgi:hypothetical protein
MKVTTNYRICSAILIVLLMACRLASPGQEKIKGVSFVAPVQEEKLLNTQAVLQVHANWAALMPYAYIGSELDTIVYNTSWQWWGERKEGVVSCIRQLKEKGLKIMLKPHLWLKHGAYTGDFKLGSDEEWSRWEKAYENYLLDFAAIAAEHQLELFCIGTELRNVVKERPEFWSNLILKVRSIYKGKLTYAANWDDYKHVPFWNQLDYIGVDAYFPLCSATDTSPTTDILVLAWEKHKTGLMNYARKEQRPVLFTEAGYRSVAHTCFQPWGLAGTASASQLDQLNAYEAMFEAFWEEDWFAGLFIWKWYNRPENLSESRYNTDYTPQGKAAEGTIRKWFNE